MDLEAASPPDKLPRDEYAHRLEAARAARATLDAREGTLSLARVSAFVAILVVAWSALGPGFLSPWWILLPIGAFLALVAAFDRVSAERRRAERRIAHYERGIARLEDRWAGTGESGSRFRDPEHPYAEDLDLFGAGSLFERLSMARTHAGQDALAAWLLSPATAEVVRLRQEAVAELRPRLDLREDVALLGGDIGAVATFEGLAAWGAEPPKLHSKALRLAAAVLALLATPTLLGWAFFGLGPFPFLAVCILELAIYLPRRKPIGAVLAAVEKSADELAILSGLLARLERESFSASELVRARSALETSGHPASRRIDHLRRLVATLESRRNMLLGPISPFLLWGTQIAFAIEAWRVRTGPAIGAWLDAIGEFEALASLANFAYESPGDPFPELIESSEPTFESEGLSHPLIPADKAVRNDVRLGGELRVLIVSGSNMSGKSTLLRAVGTGVVLAMAGSTVRARRLALSPLAVGATLRVQDNLRQGRSRFYAEILRLRQILDLANGPRPLLFLLDEILAGTNSHDRRVGAEAIVTGLVDRGAIGFVTTHDLALAEIVDRFAPRAANVHFADHLEDGVMTFDYTMRPGVVRHSNALALMRSVGLEV